MAHFYGTQQPQNSYIKNAFNWTILGVLYKAPSHLYIKNPTTMFMFGKTLVEY